jgi:rubrerythrin
LEDTCSELKGNAFAILSGNEGDYKLLDYKNNISDKFNWIEVFSQFATNYADTNLEDGFYKWGQIVPKTADYLCKDCGFIAEFEAGTVFPICEVCQAGEPDGPSTPAEGYWEEV